MPRGRTLLCVAALALGSAGALSPVVIVPGDGSNQLEARLHKPGHSPHFFCEKTSDWYRLWLSLSQLAPGVVDCWCDNVRLVVDPATGRGSNAPGVETRVPFWGDTRGFEELDPDVPLQKTAAFYYIVQALLAKGYARNTTLRGAPYDFRYTPDSAPHAYGARLRALIEGTVAAAGGAKATLVSHSMGGLQLLYFLQQQSPAWKARYVKKWVPISGPFAGAAQEWRLFATGNNAGLPVPANTLRAEQRSYETNLWLLPVVRNSSSAASSASSAGGGGGSDHVYVRTDSKNYTTADYAAFFGDIGYAVGEKVRRRVGTLIADPWRGPGVAVDCMYSTGVRTELSYYYERADFDADPVISYGDGDGTVNEASLRVCDGWGETQAAPVRTHVFHGVNHDGMITNTTVVDALVAILLAE